MSAIEWGSTSSIPSNAERYQVSSNKMIGKGNYAYIVSPLHNPVVTPEQFYALQHGDLSLIANLVTSTNPDAHVVWIKAQWESSFLYELYKIRIVNMKIETVIYNSGNSFSGLEICAIIMAASFLAAVIVGLVLSSWSVYEIFANTPPSIIPVAAIIILILIGMFLFLIFGGKGSLGANKKGISITGSGKK